MWGESHIVQLITGLTQLSEDKTNICVNHVHEIEIPRNCTFKKLFADKFLEICLSTS